MDNKIDCMCNLLEEIDEFNSLIEFKRFLKYIEKNFESSLKEIPVKIKYGGSTIFQEIWYQCSECNQTWRLVYPDFPFKGLWEKV